MYVCNSHTHNPLPPTLFLSPLPHNLLWDKAPLSDQALRQWRCYRLKSGGAEEGCCTAAAAQVAPAAPAPAELENLTPTGGVTPRMSIPAHRPIYTGALLVVLESTDGMVLSGLSMQLGLFLFGDSLSVPSCSLVLCVL